MISIVLPVIRPDKAKRCIAAIKKHAGNITYELVTAVDEDRIGCPKMVKELVKETNFDWVMFLGDDTVPEEGFMANAVAKINDLPDGWGLIGLNDGHWDGSKIATHWLAHKNMLALTDGDFFHTGYKHQFCDRELTDIARENDRYVWADDAKLEHHNGQIKREEEKDEFTQYVYSSDVTKHDRVLYLERKEERLGFVLGVGIPLIDESVETLFTYSMMLQDFPSYGLYYPNSKYHPGDIAKCRNDIARNALKDGCTHLIMMDTDQVYHDQDLVRRFIDHRLDIVAGKIHRRWPPYEPILQRDGKHVPDEEIFAGGLVPVDGIGSGCMMIRTKVFAALDYPWYKVERDKYEEVTAGEDIYFCRKAKKAGFEIFVDCDVNIGHLTTIEVNTSFYKMLKELAHLNTTKRGKNNERESR